MDEKLHVEKLAGWRFRVHLPPLYYRDIFKPSRAAEVALVITRPDGRILVHTKGHYPRAVYRIPTGTAAPGEDVMKAMWREVGEETGLDVRIERLLCRIEYAVPGGRDDLVTHAFLLRERGGILKTSDPSENITGWKGVLPSELPKVAEDLSNLEGGWAGWGLFRSVLHRIAADMLAGTHARECGEQAMLSIIEYQVLNSCADDRELFYFPFALANYGGQVFPRERGPGYAQYVDDSHWQVKIPWSGIVHAILSLCNRGFLSCYRIIDEERKVRIANPLATEFDVYRDYSCLTWEDHIARYGYGPHEFEITESGLEEIKKPEYSAHNENLGWGNMSA